MEIIYFFAFLVGAYLLAVLLAGNAKDIEDREDYYPPRHRPSSRRPIVIRDYDDDYDDDYYYRRWRANHRARTRRGAFQHTLLFLTSLVIGMLVYDGCNNKKYEVQLPANVAKRLTTNAYTQ